MATWTVGAARRRAARAPASAQDDTTPDPAPPGAVPTAAYAGGEEPPTWTQFLTPRDDMGPWEQKEGLRARITELEAIIDALSTRASVDSDRRRVVRNYASNAHRELAEAERSLLVRQPGRRRAAHLGVAQAHMDAALNLMVWMASAEDIKAMLPQIVALVEEHLAAGDPRRVRVIDIARGMQHNADRKLRPSERAFLAETVSLARKLLWNERLRVRSFVRIVGTVTIGLTIAAVAVAVITVIWEALVPLCFTPEVNGGFNVVCPTRSRFVIPFPPDSPVTSEMTAQVAQAGDYLVIEIIGVLSAAVASAAALRRIRGTSLPYNVPVVLALLKLPLGALTAVLGLLLMRGGFVPGLSALDSTAQIIAWAIVFGYSQQLFTKYVDHQGQALLDSVRGPASRSSSSPDAG
ncbi:hypothetical protein ABZY45_30690 [Streptomyces sp. NPDC006516]|uniref:hypothetical protein n=1 Tax=Streptomyces sp. NPDC006516 TaxID=3154309 RepID=UPI0033AAD501